MGKTIKLIIYKGYWILVGGFALLPSLILLSEIPVSDGVTAADAAAVLIMTVVSLGHFTYGILCRTKPGYAIGRRLHIVVSEDTKEIQPTFSYILLASFACIMGTIMLYVGLFLVLQFSVPENAGSESAVYVYFGWMFFAVGLLITLYVMLHRPAPRKQKVPAVKKQGIVSYAPTTGAMPVKKAADKDSRAAHTEAPSEMKTSTAPAPLVKAPEKSAQDAHNMASSKEKSGAAASSFGMSIPVKVFWIMTNVLFLIMATTLIREDDLSGMETLASWIMAIASIALIIYGILSNTKYGARFESILRDPISVTDPALVPARSIRVFKAFSCFSGVILFDVGLILSMAISSEGTGSEEDEALVMLGWIFALIGAFAIIYGILYRYNPQKHNCAVCNAGVENTSAKAKCADGIICRRCLAQRGFRHNSENDRKTLKTLTVDAFMNYPVLESSNPAAGFDYDKLSEGTLIDALPSTVMDDVLKNFKPTYKVDKFALFDDINKVVLLSKKIRVFTKMKGSDYRLFRYSQITGVRPLQYSIDTGGGISKTVLGGLLFGEMGAIAGAATTRRKTTALRFAIEVSLVNAASETFEIELTDMPVEVGSGEYLNLVNSADQILGKLQSIAMNEIASGAEEIARIFAPWTDDVPDAPDKFDEIREYKELLDEGIITKAEFERKKKELLNL